MRAPAYVQAAASPIAFLLISTWRAGKCRTGTQRAQQVSCNTDRLPQLLPVLMGPGSNERRIAHEGKNMLKDGSSLANFRDVLAKHGLKAGLEFLNQRVPHRFTSVYRIQHGQLHRVAFIDKLGTSGAALAHAALKDSFCEVAVQEGGLVVATDVKTDKRFQTLPNPAMLGSYVGLPLASQRGELFGTLCHADQQGYALSDAEFVFVNEAAKVLETYLEQIFPPGQKGESQ